jgi:hypothetical protein
MLKAFNLLLLRKVCHVASADPVASVSKAGFMTLFKQRVPDHKALASEHQANNQSPLSIVQSSAGWRKACHAASAGPVSSFSKAGSMQLFKKETPGHKARAQCA